MCELSSVIFWPVSAVKALGMRMRKLVFGLFVPQSVSDKISKVFLINNLGNIDANQIVNFFTAGHIFFPAWHIFFSH